MLALAFQIDFFALSLWSWKIYLFELPFKECLKLYYSGFGNGSIILMGLDFGIHKFKPNTWCCRCFEFLLTWATWVQLNFCVTSKWLSLVFLLLKSIAVYSFFSMNLANKLGNPCTQTCLITFNQGFGVVSPKLLYQLLSEMMLRCDLYIRLDLLCLNT